MKTNMDLSRVNRESPCGLRRLKLNFFIGRGVKSRPLCFLVTIHNKYFFNSLDQRAMPDLGDGESGQGDAAPRAGTWRRPEPRTRRRQPGELYALSRRNGRRVRKRTARTMERMPLIVGVSIKFVPKSGTQKRGLGRGRKEFPRSRRRRLQGTCTCLAMENPPQHARLLRMLWTGEFIGLCLHWADRKCSIDKERAERSSPERGAHRNPASGDTPRSGQVPREIPLLVERTAARPADASGRQPWQSWLTSCFPDI